MARAAPHSCFPFAQVLVQELEEHQVPSPFGKGWGGLGETGGRGGQDRAEGKGQEGGLGLGTHSCCHGGEAASSFQRGGQRWGLNSPPLYACGKRFFRISSPLASPSPPQHTLNLAPR